MKLDLVDCRNHTCGLHDPVQVLGLVVGDPDGSHPPAVKDLDHGAPGVHQIDSRGVRQGPVDEEQVEDLQPQRLHGGIEAAQRVVAPMVGIVELGSDE